MFCLILVWILKVGRKTDDHHFLLVTAQVWGRWTGSSLSVSGWKKKTRRFKSSGSQRAWCPCRTRSEDPRCYKDESERKKTRSLLKLKPWQPNAYSTLVGLVWDRCLFFHVNLPTASLLLSRSTHTASQLNRRGMFTVGRWLPTCMCGTTWPCRRWPGTSWWGWDGGRAGGRRACRAEGTWGFLTRPSNPWGRQQDLIRPKLLFFFLSSSVNVFRIKLFSLAHLRSSWTACVSWTKMSLTSLFYSLLTVSSRSSYVVMSSEDKRRTLRLVPLHNQCMYQ